MNTYRPGHADYTFDAKYGFRDYRGGGRSSGRETIGRVAAGAVACKILESLGIQVMAYTKSIGPVSIPEQDYNYSVITDNTLYMPNNQYAEKASAYLEECIRSQDSSGGIIECRVDHMPAGIGETGFEKLDANLASRQPKLPGARITMYFLLIQMAYIKKPIILVVCWAV